SGFAAKRFVPRQITRITAEVFASGKLSRVDVNTNHRDALFANRFPSAFDEADVASVEIAHGSNQSHLLALRFPLQRRTLHGRDRRDNLHRGEGVEEERKLRAETSERGIGF